MYLYEGTPRASRIATIADTTISSVSEKPICLFMAAQSTGETSAVKRYWVTLDPGIGRTAAGGIWAVVPMHITRAAREEKGGRSRLPAAHGARAHNGPAGRSKLSRAASAHRGASVRGVSCALSPRLVDLARRGGWRGMSPAVADISGHRSDLCIAQRRCVT